MTELSNAAKAHAMGQMFCSLDDFAPRPWHELYDILMACPDNEEEQTKLLSEHADPAIRAILDDHGLLDDHPEFMTTEQLILELAVWEPFEYWELHAVVEQVVNLAFLAQEVFEAGVEQGKQEVAA